MITLQVLAVAIASFVMALVLTEQFRRYAQTRGMVDVPNARSSHVQPTPRGGGIAIVATLLPCFVLLHAMDALSQPIAAALIGAGTIAATIGYLDDRRQVPLLVRLAAQFASAACAVWLVGTEPVTRALALPVSANLMVAAVVLLYLVWMLNLTNFMDGIDGILSVEVITVCTALALCLDGASSGAPNRASSELTAALIVIACATAGFLRWNWPPARIFMGDAGSGFLGILLGTLSLVAAGIEPALFWSAVILAGVFVVDATVTLLRRIGRRETFYHAHRSHAYQHASRRWSHRHVTMATGLINVCWLLPWAFLAARGSLHGAVALVLAYIPLVAAALRFRAGLPE